MIRGLILQIRDRLGRRARPLAAGLTFIGLFLALLFGSIRNLLIGGTIVSYRDWVWPPAAPTNGIYFSVYDPTFWAGVGADPGGYTRAALTWPVFEILRGAPALEVEQAFFVFIFAVAFCLALVAARLFLKIAFPHSSWTARLGLSALFVALSFLNPVSLQWEAGAYFTLLWGISLIEIALFSTILGFRGRETRFWFLAGLSLGVGALLDPRIVFWGLLPIVAYLAYECVVAKSLRRIVRQALVGLAAALPCLAVTTWAYAWAGATSSQPIRTATWASLEFASSNGSTLNVMSMLGFWWSSLTYAPPGIAGIQALGQLVTIGSPPFSVSLEGPIDAVWSGAFFGLLFVACLPLLRRRPRPIAVLFAGTALVSMALAAGTQRPFEVIAAAEVWLGGLPWIGTTAQTVFGIPGYIQTLTAAALIPLCTMGIVELWSFASSFQVVVSRTVSGSAIQPEQVVHLSLRRAGRPSRHRRAAVLVVVTVAVLMLPSWQFFTGDYFPAGYSPGAPPNGIPSEGSLMPLDIPASEASAYATVENSPGVSGVLWPGPGSYTYAWTDRPLPPLSDSSPKPVVDIPGLPYLIENNLTADFAAILQTYSVRYVVVDNMSEAGFAAAFGVESAQRVLSFMGATPGLSIDADYGNETWVYDFANPSPPFSAYNTVVVLSDPVSSIGPAAGALDGLGVSAALATDANGTAAPRLTISNLSSTLQAGSIEIVNSTSIGSSAPTGLVAGFDGVPAENLTQSIAAGGTTVLDAPFQNWSVTSWTAVTGNATVSIAEGSSIRIEHEGRSATLSLNYLSPLVDGSTQGVSVPADSSVQATVSFQYETAPGFAGEVESYIVASNSSAVNTGVFVSNSSGPSSTWRNQSFSAVLPVTSTLFTSRILATMSGQISIRDVDLSWTVSRPYPLTFTGYATSLSNSSFPTPRGPSYGESQVNLQVMGIGNLTVSAGGVALTAPVNSPTEFVWVTIRGLSLDTAGSVAVNGSLEIAGLVVLPDGGVFTEPAPTFNYTQTGSLSFELDEVSATATVLSLDEPFNTHWLASSGSSSQGSAQESVAGFTFFEISRASKSYAVVFADYVLFPTVITATAAFVAISLVFLGLVFLCPSQFAAFTRRLMRRGAGLR